MRKEGYQLLVLQSNDSLATEMLNIRVCSDQLVDGMIVSLSAETKSIEHLKDAGDVGIPIVLFDKCADNKIFDQVIINDVAAAIQCTDYLINSGAKTIAGIFGNEELSITKLRLNGFRKALQLAGFSDDSIHIEFASGMNEAKEKTLKVINDFHPDAFFYMSDEVLAGLLPAIKEAGLNIPNNCKIAGISDGTLPLILDPQVTHYHHNGFDVGAAAAKRLIELIRNPSTEHQPKTIVIDGAIKELKSA